MGIPNEELTFTTVEGKKVAPASDEVSRVEQKDDSTTTMVLRDGTRYEVSEPLDSVLGKLKAAKQEEPASGGSDTNAGRRGVGGESLRNPERIKHIFTARQLDRDKRNKQAKFKKGSMKSKR